MSRKFNITILGKTLKQIIFEDQTTYIIGYL